MTDPRLLCDECQSRPAGRIHYRDTPTNAGGYPDHDVDSVDLCLVCMARVYNVHLASGPANGEKSAKELLDRMRLKGERTLEEWRAKAKGDRP